MKAELVKIQHASKEKVEKLANILLFLKQLKWTRSQKISERQSYNCLKFDEILVLLC